MQTMSQQNIWWTMCKWVFMHSVSNVYINILFMFIFLVLITILVFSKTKNKIIQWNCFLFCIRADFQFSTLFSLSNVFDLSVIDKPFVDKAQVWRAKFLSWFLNTCEFTGQLTFYLVKCYLSDLWGA